MRRVWVAGLASLLLHAAAVAGFWKIINARSDDLRAVLVELPVVERLAPVRVSLEKTRTRPAQPRLLTPARLSSPSAPSLPEAPQPSPPQEAKSLVSVRSEQAGAASQNDLASGPVSAVTDSVGPNLSPTRSSSASVETPPGTGIVPAKTLSGPGPGFPSGLAVPVRDVSPGDGRYLGLLRSRVEAALVYPAPARRRGLTGVVELEIRLGLDGSVERITVARSSGHALLDQAAVRGVAAAAPFPPPADLPSGPLTVLLPIAFELR